MDPGIPRLVLLDRAFLLRGLRVQRDTQQGLTRREALKRGAVIAGGLAWATPLVQAVGMSPAFAATTSPVRRNCCESADGSTVKFASLTMKYLGGDNFCSGYTAPLALLTCTDTPNPPNATNPLPDPAHIIASHQPDIFKNGVLDTTKRIWFNSNNPSHSPTGPIPVNGTFVMAATNATETELKGNTWVHIFDGSQPPSPTSYRQKIELHTSCSVPLYTGDRFGGVELVDCTPAPPKKPTSESLTEEPSESETELDAETTEEAPAGG